MGAMEVVEGFPLGQLSGEIDIVCIGQQLVEISLIDLVGWSTFPFNWGVLGLI